MTRIGLTPDWLAATPSPPRRYVARLGTLRILAGETLALVGTGTRPLLHELADALPACTWVEGATAARGGVLRVHAQQAQRVGMRAVAISGPVEAQLDPHARGLAIADLAGLAELGLTSVAETADAGLAALFADRIVIVVDGVPLVTYPVIAPVPRRVNDVRPVTERVTARLAAIG